MKEYNITTSPDMQWGAMFTPAHRKPLNKPGLRAAIFASCDCGNDLLQSLGLFEQKYPEQLNIVGVATDDPVDPQARISKKKRIWSQFSEEQQKVLYDKVIETTMNLGTQCYSGAVKSDYFRSVYAEWNPDVLIMFCYGQWLDPVIYETPRLGAYNLHPSNLPKKIGAGTQPFQEAMKSGVKTSRLTIHQVTDLIDMGPVTGVSPAINICLEDGSYPPSLLTLLYKLTSPGSYMATQLVVELTEHLLTGKTGPVDCIGFDKIFPHELKEFLMKPAVMDVSETYALPLHPALK